MKLSRYWVMPSAWTFSMSPVKKIFSIYGVGPGYVDPFSGENSPAEFTNDIERRGNKSQLDGLEFLKTFEDNSVCGALFDPPYSVEQCLRKYTSKYKGTAGRTEYRARCKDEISRIVKPGGISISFGWSSVGIGKVGNFEIIEIVLLCHGGGHPDTIITIERAL